MKRRSTQNNIVQNTKLLVDMYNENRNYGNNIVSACVQDWIIYIYVYEGIRIVLDNEAIHGFSAHQTLLGRHESRRMRTAVEISDGIL